MLRQMERALTDAERLELTARRDEARAARRTSLLRFGGASVLVCGSLGLLTWLASDAPAWVVAAFWAALAVLFTLWTGLPMRRHHARVASALEDGLRGNRARETRVTTPRVVEVEEVEDEGACFAFDAGEGRAIFVIGQEFYPDERFPNSDFSYVEVLGTRGAVADVIVTMHGERIEPERRVSAERKLAMDVPEHLQVVPVAIDAVGR